MICAIIYVNCGLWERCCVECICVYHNFFYRYFDNPLDSLLCKFLEYRVLSVAENLLIKQDLRNIQQTVMVALEVYIEF